MVLRLSLPHGSLVLEDSSSPLVFGAVCIAWRNIVRSTPQLWTKSGSVFKYGIKSLRWNSYFCLFNSRALCLFTFVRGCRWKIYPLKKIPYIIDLFGGAECPLEALEDLGPLSYSPLFGRIYLTLQSLNAYGSSAFLVQGGRRRVYFASP